MPSEIIPNHTGGNHTHGNLGAFRQPNERSMSHQCPDQSMSESVHPGDLSFKMSFQLQSSFFTWLHIKGNHWKPNQTEFSQLESVDTLICLFLTCLRYNLANSSGPVGLYQPRFLCCVERMCSQGEKGKPYSPWAGYFVTYTLPLAAVPVMPPYQRHPTSKMWSVLQQTSTVTYTLLNVSAHVVT